MSITSYERDGKIFWRVYIGSRCKSDRSIRVQKGISAIETREEAEILEKRAIKQVAAEVAKRESYGKNWYDIIGAWELANRDAGYQERQITTVIDMISVLHRYTESWLRKPASQIHKGDVREVFADLQTQGKTKKLQQRVKQAINMVYNWAIEERLINDVPHSPARGVFIQKEKQEKRPEILTVEQIRKLLAFAKELKDPWYPIWAAALLTGMRNGELFALLWSDIDFQRKRITVSKSYNNRLRQVKSTKAGYWRTVPISDELCQILTELKVGAGVRKEVLPRLSGWAKGNQAATLRTFCLGIGLPSVRFHTLRACFATQLLSNDVAPATVMKVCGWKDLKTMQRYIRLAGIDESGATDTLKFLPTEESVMEKAATMYEHRMTD